MNLEISNQKSKESHLSLCDAAEETSIRNHSPSRENRTPLNKIIFENSPEKLQFYFNNLSPLIDKDNNYRKATVKNKKSFSLLPLKLDFENINNQYKPELQSKKSKCTCKKSHCQKLYCECFANREFCFQCTCSGCHNTYSYQLQKNRIVKEVKEEKVSCKCTKSNCQKKYCECYKEGRICNKNCRCITCENVHPRTKKIFTQTKTMRKSEMALLEIESISINIIHNQVRIIKKKIL